MKKKTLPLLLSLVIAFSLNFKAFATENNIPKNAEPKIYGKSAITIDIQTGEIIYSKDIDKQMYPASTTKLMTALILAENKQKNDIFKYTEKAKAQPEYSLNLNIHAIDIGETMSAENAMDGLLLYSGNDIAYMIAENVGTDDIDFRNKMNEKVKQLNLKNSHFVTPNGLHDPNHYTTAYDLSTIATTSFKNPWVRESMGKSKSTLKTSKGTTFIVENRNKLLDKNGCIAGKTGYTSQSGRCLVAVYERNGRKILGVVMNSVYDAKDEAVFNDMDKIIDWSYSAKPTLLYKSGDTVITKSIKYKPLIIVGPEKTINLPIHTNENVLYYDNYINKDELKKEMNVSNINVFSLNSKNSIGTLTVKERNISKNYKLYTSVSKGTLFKSNIAIYAAAGAIVLSIAGIIGFCIKKLVDMRRRKRRGKYI